MLRKILQEYITQFREAAGSGDPSESLALLDRMTKDLRDKPPAVEDVRSEIHEIVKNGETSISQLVLQAAWACPDPSYSQGLACIVVTESLQALHEPAIELLGEIGDDNAVSAIASAIKYRWSYDEWLNVPKKALFALARIGSPEARAAIRGASSSSEESIRAEAELLLTA